jgi:hypothetical protein
MSASLRDLNTEVMRLRQHITWLHGTLQRLGDLQVLASTIDAPRELCARVDYARAALANSLRRCVEVGVADRPPSLAALVVGQALAQPPEERDVPAARLAPARRPEWSVAWCSFDGQIHVAPQAPADEVWLAEGPAVLLWHWIEELAVFHLGRWHVPHITHDASLSARAEAAMNFGHALAEAGRTILPCTAPPAGRAPA